MKTQGRRLIDALKVRPHTYGEMQRLGISTAPHRRISESLARNEIIIKTKGNDGLIRWRVKTLIRA